MPEIATTKFASRASWPGCRRLDRLEARAAPYRMESTDTEAAQAIRARHRRRRRGVLWVAALALLAVIGLAVAQPPESWIKLREIAGEGIYWVRGLGAGWFFVAFALLSGVGVPVSVFSFSAGPVFGPVLGLPTVLALAGLSLAVSLTISYGLARYGLRPWVKRLLNYLGYEVPRVPPEKHHMVTAVARITPGPPYVLQSFLLGLAEVPFFTYLWISWLISTANTSLVIVAGDALAHGNAASRAVRAA
ncbi:MAG: DedA family protein [Verrucomicrobia bacterium]|nr:MAG: DedA family protein [Verrucomicrobiota bacterium]